MDHLIRGYGGADEAAVVALSIRAWAPVFASMARVLGPELDRRPHGVWQTTQAAAVRQVLGARETEAWVAVEGEAVVGFVTVRVADPALRLGEIGMLAVDPAAQRRGWGRRLADHATDRLRERGMQVVMIDTGGDPGHAPARATYAAAGFTPMPLVRYFKAV